MDVISFLLFENDQCTEIMNNWAGKKYKLFRVSPLVDRGIRSPDGLGQSFNQDVS